MCDHYDDRCNFGCGARSGECKCAARAEQDRQAASKPDLLAVIESAAMAIDMNAQALSSKSPADAPYATRADAAANLDRIAATLRDAIAKSKE